MQISSIQTMKHAMKNHWKLSSSILLGSLLCAIPFLVVADPPGKGGTVGTSPMDELRNVVGRQDEEAKRCVEQASAYHRKEEYDLSYRLYARCVARGWTDGRAFYLVMDADARKLATKYHEQRLTVLFDDGSKKPEQWPVAHLSPAVKTAIWKEKGVTPKRDWLTRKNMEAILADHSQPTVEVSDEKPDLTLEECRRTLAMYDLLREHIQSQLKQTENRLVEERPGDKELEALRLDLLKLKENVRTWRTRFVSYNLVSPFLAETVRLRRIAKDSFFQMLFNHRANAGKRLDAVSMLALACHKDILLSCTEDVRIQFCDTISGLKRISKPAEWEHFTVLTTMLDSYDPGKKRGADAWWE